MWFIWFFQIHISKVWQNWKPIWLLIVCFLLKFRSFEGWCFLSFKKKSPVAWVKIKLKLKMFTLAKDNFVSSINTGHYIDTNPNNAPV